MDGIHDGVDCFISEIGEIKISGITDEQLNVRIETGGMEIFNENYYALKGNVVIHEIGEMLRSYFSLHDPKGMSSNVVSYYQAPLSITAVFSDKQDTVRRSFKAYYSRCCTSLSPSEALFLTHENSVRTAYDRMEYLTFIVREGISVDIGVAYLDMGRENTSAPVRNWMQSSAWSLYHSLSAELPECPVLKLHPSYIMMSC